MNSTAAFEFQIKPLHHKQRLTNLHLRITFTCKPVHVSEINLAKCVPIFAVCRTVLGWQQWPSMCVCVWTYFTRLISEICTGLQVNVIQRFCIGLKISTPPVSSVCQLVVLQCRGWFYIKMPYTIYIELASNTTGTWVTQEGLFSAWRNKIFATPYIRNQGGIFSSCIRRATILQARLTL